MSSTHSDSAVLMLDLEGTQLSAQEHDLLQHPAVGGLILFARNYREPAQLQDLVAAVRQSRDDLLIAVDQEGGRVQRFREGFLTLPSLHEIALTAQQDQPWNFELVSACAWAMAAEVLHYGVDFSFAPVLDLYNPVSRVIAERALAASADDLVPLARAYIDGMHRAGMAATGKHFPGHGSVAADSHHELPRDERPAEEILEQDYRVFAECIDVLDAVMPAHVVYPALDDACAGFSRYWVTGKLRQELGFDGVVFSDDLTMAAAGSVGSVEARAELALDAGCDMVLVCNNQPLAQQLADWLARQNDSALKAQFAVSTQRLQRMRAIASPDTAQLFATDAWQQAVAAVDTVTAHAVANTLDT